MPDGPEVRRMFARVARRYDRANHVLSLGIDHLWRRAAVRYAGLQPGERVLDVCAGTGDLSIVLARAGGAVTGGDFCPEMLQLADAKAAGRNGGGGRPRFLGADTLRLPFRDAAFDLATVAFGIRNVSDPVAGLAEMGRVVRPGGRIVVLEFCRPRTPGLSGLYSLYFRRVLPRIGGWITGDAAAYRYLPDSVQRFPERAEFAALMTRAGLADARFRVLTGGIAALYRAEVPA